MLMDSSAFHCCCCGIRSAASIHSVISEDTVSKMEIKKGLNCNPATGINNSKRFEHEYIESVMVLPSLDQS